MRQDITGIYERYINNLEELIVYAQHNQSVLYFVIGQTYHFLLQANGYIVIMVSIRTEQE